MFYGNPYGVVIRTPQTRRILHPVLNEAIAYCESCGDYITRELFEKILETEEEHIDWLEIQLSLVEKLGVQNWLQSWNGAS
ncbi:MAG: hypothetical protein A3H32_05195 [Betaproteobacteria bacterium RIFCSPLOWO2_02_FULL_63_19]|nr:MAG: hypothetical protein A3H32_05195 [Betaproteobacteria bacterium RIFCSPLOWO2_02_FULL_63_19]